MSDLVDQAEAREAEARACFVKHDLDGSSTINASELATVLTTLGLKKDGVRDEEFAALVGATLKEHDANADGVLQFEEFVVMYNAVAGAGPKKGAPDDATLLAIFNKLDTNGNGSLDKAELLAATKKFGDEAVAGVLADKLDLNADGQIDLAEFCAGFAKIDMNKKLAVNALAVAAGVGLPNAAFVFIKPHANTEAVRALVKEKFAERGIRIVAEGQIDAETIDKDKLIDQHYYAIASKATLVKPKDMPVPADTFEEKFGISWESALADDLAFNAIDAADKLGVDVAGLDKVWQEAKEAGLLVKFGGGFYCGKVGDIYVFNGFFMTMRSNFVAPGASIYYFSVEWDAARLKWAAFRGEVLGPTDPASAPEGSLRADIYAKWESLGLPSVPTTAGRVQRHAECNLNVNHSDPPPCSPSSCTHDVSS